MNRIEPFRMGGCYKVLPLVYDDSLSYYENLCKMSSKLNEVIAEYNKLFESGMQEAIDKYFNNVMIDAIYDEPTKTITLKKELIVGDGNHVYSAETGIMTIE